MGTTTSPDGGPRPALRMVQAVLDGGSQAFLRSHPDVMASSGVEEDDYAHHVTLHYLQAGFAPIGLHDLWQPGADVEILGLGHARDELVQALVVTVDGETHQLMPPGSTPRRLHVTLAVRGDRQGRPVMANDLLQAGAILTPVTWRLSGRIAWVELLDPASKLQRLRYDDAVIEEYRHLVSP